MNQQLIIAALIELGLILLTSLLLVQPALIFSKDRSKPRTSRISSIATTGGLVLLCATFMWSLIFGSILALNRIPVWVPSL